MKPYEQKTYNELLEFVVTNWKVFEKSGVPAEGLAKAALKQILATGDETVVWNALYRKAGYGSETEMKEKAQQLEKEIETTLRSMGTAESDIPHLTQRLVKKAETQGTDKVRLMLKKMGEQAQNTSVTNRQGGGPVAEADKKIVLYRHLSYAMQGAEFWTAMPNVGEFVGSKCFVEHPLTDETFAANVKQVLAKNKIPDVDKQVEVAVKLYQKDRLKAMQALEGKFKCSLHNVKENTILAVRESEEEGFEVLLEFPHGWSEDTELKVSNKDGCPVMLLTEMEMKLEKRHRAFFVGRDKKDATAQKAAAAQITPVKQGAAPAAARKVVAEADAAAAAAASSAAATGESVDDGDHKEVSDKLHNVLVKCQPFKDNVATIICRKCFALMVFPSSASKVKCSSCKTVTSGIRVDCLSCKKQLDILLSDQNTVCTHCNFTFSKAAAFQLKLPKHVKEVRQVEGSAVTKVKVPASIKTVIMVHPSLKVGIESHYLPMPWKLKPSQPLEEHVEAWGNTLKCDMKKVSVHLKGRSDALDLSKTPKQLGLKNSSELEFHGDEVQSGGGTAHRFEETQLVRPTCCAVCKKFIWGVYKQAKKCSRCDIPVHHKCAARATSVCEAALREMMGADFGFPESCEDDDAVEAIAIEEDDVNDFKALADEVIENDTADDTSVNFLTSLHKISNFSDDEIQAMWQNYDADGSGKLERDEVAKLMADICRSLAGDGQIEIDDSAVDFLMLSMDSNQDGVIEWEEFYWFYKGQQTDNFIETFRNTKGDLTTEQLYEIWYHYDRNNSGTLGMDQLLKLMNDIGGARDHGAQLEAIVASGKPLTWEEFFNQVVPLIQESRRTV